MEDAPPSEQPASTKEDEELEQPTTQMADEAEDVQRVKIVGHSVRLYSLAWYSDLVSSSFLDPLTRRRRLSSWTRVIPWETP